MRYLTSEQEYDRRLALNEYRLRPSGATAMKVRVFNYLSQHAVVVHKALWMRLDDEEKDEQIRRIKVAVGVRKADEKHLPENLQWEERSLEL